MKSFVMTVDMFSFFQETLAFILVTTFSPAPLSVSVMEEDQGMMNFGETRAEGGIHQTQEWITKPVSNELVFPASNILWGAAATALVGATLAEWERKREEEKQAKLRELEERRANGPSSYRQAGMAYQRSLDNFKATLIEDGFSAAEAQALKSQAIQDGHIQSASAVIKEKRDEEVAERAAEAAKEQENRVAYIEMQKASLAEAARKAEEEEKRKAAELQAGLLAYYQSRKDGEVASSTVTPQEEDEKMAKNQFFENTYKWTAENIPGLINIKEKVEQLKPLQFITRKDGRFSVSVDQMLAGMKSGEFLKDIAEEGFEFSTGGGYKPLTLLSRSTEGIMRASVPQGLELASPFFFNTLEYTIGDKKNEDEKIQGIVLDSLVDIAGTIATGLAAAVAVTVTVGVIAVVLEVTVPIAIVLGATLVLGLGLDFILEVSGAKNPIKEWANQQWNEKAEPIIGNFLEKAGQFISVAFNQPVAPPVQPPIPNPEPSITTNPTSTPTPEELGK